MNKQHPEPTPPWTVADPEFSPEQVAHILARRANELARPLDEEVQGAVVNLLVFQLGDERYGIDVTEVLEIYPMQPVTPVPRTPDFVVGIFSARGRFLSVLDLRALLGRSKGDILPQSHIVVTAVHDLEVAFLVDAIDDVRLVYENELNPPLSAAFTRGIAPGLVAVLDLQALLADSALIVNEEMGN